MKKLSIFLLIWCGTPAVAAANELAPVAVQTVTPDRTWFYNLEDVVFSMSQSYVPSGYITQTDWSINGVYHDGGSYSRSMSVCFALEGTPAGSGCYQLAAGATTVQVTLKVYSNHGYTDEETLTYTIKEYKGRKYFIKDHLGSVRTTVNRDGKVLGYDDYYPFGLTMPGRSSNSANPNDKYKFTGHELDQEAGLNLINANARMMDPVIGGRFLQIDPHYDNYPGVSPYAYVGNNPLIYSDPTGKDWYLNLQQGTVVWFDGSDDRYDDGFVNIGELNGLDGTSVGDITDRLDELGYEYGMSAEKGLVVDTEGRYKAWAMEQIFSPENVGLILMLGEAVGAPSPRRQATNLVTQEAQTVVQNSTGTLQKAKELAQSWLGKGYRTITNKAGDKIYISRDGTRKIRFDMNNPGGDKQHIHLEVLENGKWKDATDTHRIYPKQN